MNEVALFFVEHGARARARTPWRWLTVPIFVWERSRSISLFPDPALLLLVRVHVMCVARSATKTAAEKPAQHVFRLKVEDLRDRRCYRIIVSSNSNRLTTKPWSHRRFPD